MLWVDEQAVFRYFRHFWRARLSLCRRPCDQGILTPLIGPMRCLTCLGTSRILTLISCVYGDTVGVSQRPTQA